MSIARENGDLQGGYGNPLVGAEHRDPESQVWWHRPAIPFWGQGRDGGGGRGWKQDWELGSGVEHLHRWAEDVAQCGQSPCLGWPSESHRCDQWYNTYLCRRL